MKTVLVTGGDGQLASCIKSEAKNVEEVKFIIKNSSELDITSKEKLDTFFSDNIIDYCINCAAYTRVDAAEDNIEKAFKINSEAVRNLAEICKKTKTVLIHVSTDFVFDGNKKEPYNEMDTPDPQSVYGSSKLEGEKEIISVLKEHFIIRTSWLYSEYGNNFMKTMLRLANNNSNINVVEDQQGSPTYARDLATFILKIIETQSNKFGVYHYSNLGKTSWYGFAKEIFKLSNNSIDIKPIGTKDYPTPAKRPRFSVLDTTKAQNTFNITIPKWNESLEMTLKVYLTK